MKNKKYHVKPLDHSKKGINPLGMNSLIKRKRNAKKGKLAEQHKKTSQKKNKSVPATLQVSSIVDLLSLINSFKKGCSYNETEKSLAFGLFKWSEKSKTLVVPPVNGSSGSVQNVKKPPNKLTNYEKLRVFFAFLSFLLNVIDKFSD